jgi:hypothetical protein
MPVGDVIAGLQRRLRDALRGGQRKYQSEDFQLHSFTLT